MLPRVRDPRTARSGDRLVRIGPRFSKFFCSWFGPIRDLEFFNVLAPSGLRFWSFFNRLWSVDPLRQWCVNAINSAAKVPKVKPGNRNNTGNRCWDSTQKCPISPLIVFQRIRVSGEIEHFVSGEIRHFRDRFRHLMLKHVYLLNIQRFFISILFQVDESDFRNENVCLSFYGIRSVSKFERIQKSLQFCQDFVYWLL